LNFSAKSDSSAKSHALFCKTAPNRLKQSSTFADTVKLDRRGLGIESSPPDEKSRSGGFQPPRFLGDYQSVRRLEAAATKNTTTSADQRMPTQSALPSKSS
jgi:hypothetical protein